MVSKASQLITYDKQSLSLTNMIKARLKKTITSNLKEGTELVKYGNIFCNDQTCFTADLIYGNPNFELIETSDVPSPDDKSAQSL